MLVGNLALAERRGNDRDEVHHRVRATGADGRQLPAVIVNLSLQGLMARCDSHVAVGEKIRVPLPGIGHVVGDVRWALGGRMGLQFTVPIDADLYDGLLTALSK